MGLREKVALVLLITLTLLACRHCMPKAQRKTSWKNNLSNLRHTPNNNPKPSPPVQANSKSKCSNVRNAPSDEKSVFNTYNFPETEYPTDGSPSNLFNYGIQKKYPNEVVGKRTPNPRTDALLNDLKKEIKLKRKLNKINTENSQTKREMTSTPAFEPNLIPYCFSDAGTFPEVQYPMSVMETWTPNYWNPLPFSEKEQTFDILELNLINANKQSNTNPAGLKTNAYSKKSKPRIGKIEFAKPKQSNKTNQEPGRLNVSNSSICDSASENSTDTGKQTSLILDTLISSNTTHASTLVSDSNYTHNSLDALKFNSFTPQLSETCPANLNASVILKSEQASYPNDLITDLLMNGRDSDLIEIISLILNSDNFDRFQSSPIPLPYQIYVQDIDICPAFDNSTSTGNTSTSDEVTLLKTNELDPQIFNFTIIDKEKDELFTEIEPYSKDINVNSITNSVITTHDSGPLLLKLPLPVLTATIPDATPDLEYLLDSDSLPILERSLIYEYPVPENDSDTKTQSAEHVAQNTPPLPQESQDATLTSIDTGPADLSQTMHNHSLMDTATNPLITNLSFIDTSINALINETSPSSQSVSDIDLTDPTKNIMPNNTPIDPTQLAPNNSTTYMPGNVLSANLPLQTSQTTPIISSTIPSNIEVTVHHYHHLVNDNTPPPTTPTSNLSPTKNLEDILPKDTSIFPTDPIPRTTETPLDSLTNQMPLATTQAIPGATESSMGSLSDIKTFTLAQEIPSTVETPTDSINVQAPVLPVQATSIPADIVIPIDYLTENPSFISVSTPQLTTIDASDALTDWNPIPFTNTSPSSSFNKTTQFPLSPTKPDVTTTFSPVDSVTPTISHPSTQIISIDSETLPIQTQDKNILHSLPEDLLLVKQSHDPYIPVDAYPIVEDTFRELTKTAESSASDIQKLVGTLTVNDTVEDQPKSLETFVPTIQMNTPFQNTLTDKTEKSVDDSTSPVANNDFLLAADNATSTDSTNERNALTESSISNINLVGVSTIEDIPLLKDTFLEPIAPFESNIPNNELSQEIDIPLLKLTTEEIPISLEDSNSALLTKKILKSLIISDSTIPRQEHVAKDTPISASLMSIPLIPLNEVLSNKTVDKNCLSEEIYENGTSREDISTLDNPIYEFPEERLLTLAEISHPANPVEDSHILDTSFLNISEDIIPSTFICPTMPLDGYPLTVQTVSTDKPDITISQFSSILNNDSALLEMNILLPEFSKSEDSLDNTIPTNLLTNDIMDPDIATGLISLTNETNETLGDMSSDIPTNEPLSNTDDRNHDTPLFDILTNDLHSSSNDMLKYVPRNDNFSSDISSPVINSMKNITPDTPVLDNSTKIFTTAEDFLIPIIETHYDELFTNNDTFEDSSPLYHKLSDNLLHPDYGAIEDALLYDDGLTPLNNEEHKDASLYNILPTGSFVGTILPYNKTDTDSSSKTTEDDLHFLINDAHEDPLVFESPLLDNLLSSIDDTLKDIPFETPLSGPPYIDQICTLNDTHEYIQLPYARADSLFDTAVSEIPTDKLNLPNNDMREITFFENDVDDDFSNNDNKFKDSVFGFSLSEISGNESPLSIDDITTSYLSTDKLPFNELITNDFIASQIPKISNNESSNIINNTNNNMLNHPSFIEFPVNELPLFPEDTVSEIPSSDPVMETNDILIETPKDDLPLFSENTLQYTDTPETSIPTNKTIDDEFSPPTVDKDTTLGNPLSDSYTEDKTQSNTADAKYSDTFPEKSSSANEVLDNSVAEDSFSEDSLSKHIILSDTALTDYPLKDHIDTKLPETITNHQQLKTEESKPDLSHLNTPIGDLPLITHETNSNDPSDNTTSDVFADNSDKNQDFSMEDTLSHASQATFLDAVSDDLSLHMHKLASDIPLNIVPFDQDIN